jgi:hypothetical protein
MTVMETVFLLQQLPGRINFDEPVMPKVLD